LPQMNTDLVKDINQSLEISINPIVSPEELRDQLSVHINYLINHDFEKLVSLLYRIDVNEQRMRNLLEQQQGENAAGLIAELIIERQLQKIESRKRSAKDDTIPEEEKW
jgi:hypothetical protein